MNNHNLIIFGKMEESKSSDKHSNFNKNKKESCNKGDLISIIR